MAVLKDTLIQGSARVTDTLYANTINTSILNTDSLNTNEDITLTSTSGNSPAIIFDRGSTNTDWKLLVTAGKLSFQSRTGTNAFTERGYFADNSGAFQASKYNGLTLTAATTGFTIAGGTTSKTLTVSDTITLKTGSATYLAYYSAAGTISGHSLAHFADEFGSSVANKKNELVLGNATAKATNGSSWGQIALYSPGTKGTYINSAENSTAWYTATLQAKTGTIAYTDDITTAIQGLDSTLPTGSAASKTLTALTITDGKMTAATFSDISIGASQVSSGTLDSARIPTLSITDKTSGTLTVARGGTGVTSFTNDCAVVSTGTTQTLVSRGLKITGGINENVVITSYGSGKTLTVESSDTLILNKPAGSSISFRSNGTIIGQFNRNGSLQIGNETNATQTDYKLYVRDGNFGLTGKIAFNTNITTENASIQYINSGLFYRGTVLTGTGVAAGGNGTNGYTGARWVFNLGIDVPTNGDRITIKVPVASHDYGTYISTDNGTTFRPVGINGSTTRLTGQFPANSIVTLVYDSTGTINSLFPPTTGATSRANSNTTTIPGAGCWRLVNYYDSGNDGLWYVRYYNLKAQTAIKAIHIIGGTDSGYNHVDSGTAFDIRYPLLYAGSAISAGSAGSNNFLFHYAINIKNSSETNISSFTAYKPVYIKGTISGMMFTPISGGNPYVQAITEAEDGYIYYYIGRAYASNAITFDATARAMFWYKNGAVTIYNALNATYTKNTSGTLEWVSGAAANEYLLTKNAIAYWNGAYAGTSSNLAYCNKGAFGTIITKSTSDYVALDSNNNATISGTFLASNTSSEPQIKVSSGAGNIYLYSQTSSTGNRGLYGYNAAGTGAYLLTVDQNNNITIPQTLILSKTQDASGTADSGPALIVGTRSGEHLEIDGNEIMAKASGTTTGSLYLNNDGGATIFGGIIQVKGRIVGITTNATKGTTPTANLGGYIPFGEVGYTGTDAKNRIGMLYSYVDTANTAHTALYAYKSVKDSTVNTFFAVSITNAGTPVKRTHTDALIYGAVWNDYAEYRASTAKEPGRVLVEDTDGVMKIAQSRLLPGCRVYSDTFGMAIGETEKDNTPIAVSGRVLVYPYRDRKEYHLGDAVCSAPNGTVDIMSREEIMTYPERIIGTVSEIPDYEEWECGYCYETEPEQQPVKNAVKVNGRIWIYVR